MRIWLGVLTTSMALAATPPAMAQSGWEQELAIEIELAQKCKVAYLSHVVERTVDGKQLVMAKVHCEDQRVFDALRPDAYEPFQFNECEADKVKAC